MKALKVVLKVLLGIVLIAIGALGIYLWRWDVLTLIKGSIGLIFVFAGIIALLVAKE